MPCRLSYMREMKAEQIDVRLDGNIIYLSAGEWHWKLKRYGDLEELWESMGVDDPDERIPYWTELWPSSLALARWLAEREDEIRDKICLDLGCGLGFTALVGQKLGARVIAADYELKALEYCLGNAALNGLEPPLCAAMDWRAPALLPRSLSRVWAGDVIYEKRFIEPVLDMLDYGLEEGGLAWIAEPGRAIFDLFLNRAKERNFSITKKITDHVPDFHNERSKINVSVWEVGRK